MTDKSESPMMDGAQLDHLRWAAIDDIIT